MRKIILIFILFFLIDVLFAKEKVINVLCYHRFAEEIKKTKGLDSYIISVKNFEEQMKFLKENGYSVIKMDDYIQYIKGKKDIPEKSVLITIDDGYKSIYDIAYPILKRYGYPATIYLYQVFFPGGKNALNLNQVKEMLKDGFEFGCHSATHPVLTRKGNKTDEEYEKFLEDEIIKPKKYLEKLLGVEINTMAYPYGAYSKEIFKIMEKAGYELGFSVVPSYNTKDTYKYALKRTMIFVSTKIDEFKRILERKPLKLKSFYPGDGDIINEESPELKAVLYEDSFLNTATIKFKIENNVIKESIYNSETKMLRYSYSENNKILSNGVNVIKVIAEGKDKSEYEYAWLFVIRRAH